MSLPRKYGKDSFFLVGEITLPRSDAIALMDTTGLDAAIGLDGVQDEAYEYSLRRDGRLPRSTSRFSPIHTRSKRKAIPGSVTTF